ncbi:hypothetical protein [Peribacillus huizhouensis]|uniref:Uncharacterized protein n=1 Tax=Peribacillus huizhouensis TaxID=1501239 RepID=A0ABR6CQ71_9BACI|nr:hypothetical protein [Peribacillus huizhouensis]MBA9027110.1 hypothetical protein [Peribacillus huizhouensis]
MMAIKRDVFYELKKHGTNAERKINKKIQDSLNKKEIIELASLYSNQIAPQIKRNQDNIEMLSVALNFPTKRDIANIAKMTVQLEEKLDKLDETLATLFQKNPQINMANPTTSPSERRKRLIKILQTYLSSGNNANETGKFKW